MYVYATKGRAVFNYDFGSVTKESPVIQAVYSTLKEVRTGFQYKILI